MIEPRKAMLGKWILNRYQIIAFKDHKAMTAYEVVAGAKVWRAINSKDLVYCEERPRDSIKVVFEFEEDE
jgi:hypothetical protein